MIRTPAPELFLTQPVSQPGMRRVKKQMKLGIILQQAHVGGVGAPGSIETDEKDPVAAPEELTISLEKQRKNLPEPPPGDGGPGWVPGLRKHRGGGDTPGKQGISPPRSSKGAL